MTNWLITDRGCGKAIVLTRIAALECAGDAIKPRHTPPPTTMAAREKRSQVVTRFVCEDYSID